MKNVVKILVMLSLAVFLVSGNSFAYTIMDNYRGGEEVNYANTDVVGPIDKNDTTKMEVTISGNDLAVDVYSRYLNNIGYLDTELGDLFISTNGWNPYGVEPYEDDTYITGEPWEYALVLDDHDGALNTGYLSLWGIEQGTTRLSDYYKLSHSNWGGYRKSQEVRFDPTPGEVELATGSWEIFNSSSDPDTDDYLRFSINYTGISAFENASELGFHWTFTCANDVIEGSASVPEPATLLLLGSGFIGLAVVGRKKLIRIKR